MKSDRQSLPPCCPFPRRRLCDRPVCQTRLGLTADPLQSAAPADRRAAPSASSRAEGPGNPRTQATKRTPAVAVRKSYQCGPRHSPAYPPTVPIPFQSAVPARAPLPALSPGLPDQSLVSVSARALQRLSARFSPRPWQAARPYTNRGNAGATRPGCLLCLPWKIRRCRSTRPVPFCRCSPRNGCTPC